MRILFLLVFVCSFFISDGQTYKQLVKFADKNYEAGDFYSASLYYRKALDIDSMDIHIVWKYAECLRNYNDYETAERIYGWIYYREQSKVYPLSLFWLATMQQYNAKYKEASKNFKTVTKQFGRDKKSYEYLKSKQSILSCSFAMRSQKKDTSGFSIRNAGPSINTTDSEFGNQWIDSTLYFGSLRADNVKGDFEIHDPYYKIKIYRIGANPQPTGVSDALDSLINSVTSHNANGSFNHDRSKFVFTRCANGKCQLYLISITNGKWSAPKAIGGGVNKEGYNSTQPHFSRKGENELLFFASDMPGGQGKYDIWFSEVNGNTFAKPKNAGKKVNSIDDEITPFYDGFEGVLYFSSNWHEGFGGFDIFSAKGDPEKLGEPVNLLQPINTQWNDMYYAPYPSKYAGFLTSNRKGSYFKKSPTCCNDIYLILWPKQEIPADTIPYKSLQDLNKYLPVTLYFHNDEPNPRSTDTITRLNYMTTYQAYTAMIEKYKDEYSKGLDAAAAEKAKDDIENFFMDYVDKGVSDLMIFTKLLLIELEKGQKIELTIKGFASPLAKTDYNVNLTQRRISSLINFLREYEGGVFVPYIDGTAANGGQLFFTRVPFGEYSANSFVSDNYHDTKNSVYSRAAALERKIEVQTVQRASADSIHSEMRVNKEAHDFGKAKTGDVLTTKFIIKNVGKDDLVIQKALVGCECLSVDYPKTPLKPGESAEVTVTFRTAGYSGMQVRSVTLVTNGFPPNKRLVVTTELFAP